MHRLMPLAVLFAALLSACSSAPAAPTLAPGATATPVGATAAPTVGPVGQECAAVPTFSLSNPDPSFGFTRDTELEARFPTQIDGQPVTDVESLRWIELICLFGGQAAVEEIRQEGVAGIDLATMSFGSAEATVDGESVKINAFRTPGRDANQLVASLAQLMLAAGSDVPSFSGQPQAVTVGGKSVLAWADEDGNPVYMYVAGDTLIGVDSVTESQANKIFAALT